MNVTLLLSPYRATVSASRHLSFYLRATISRKPLHWDLETLKSRPQRDHEDMQTYGKICPLYAYNM
jgi:hypothetical protein